jgi:SAM-dependent methyltransferase
MTTIEYEEEGITSKDWSAKMEATQTVQVFNGLEKRVLPKLADTDKTANVIVCGETRPFRMLARHLCFPGDPKCAIDLGCSTGATTAILAKRFHKVIGLDISTVVVEKGRLDHPGVDLRVLDVLTDRRVIVDLINQEMNGHIPLFFVDIGGDRMQDIVIIYLSFLIETFTTPIIVVKSRNLYRYLVNSSLAENGIYCKAEAWGKLIVDTKEEELRDRKCFHPQRYHMKLAPDSGLPMCRYHNYSICRKGDSCDQDHNHCHHCSEFGHRGFECQQLAVDLIVRKKKT